MKRLVVLLSMLLIPILSHAWTVVPGGIQVNISYTEPNTNSNGSPLKDLLKTIVYYNAGAGDLKAFEAPAIALTGNGNIIGTAVIPWPSDKQGNVDFYAVAIDTTANISAKSTMVTVQFDTLSPSIPKVLTISGNMLFFNYREPMVNTD